METILVVDDDRNVCAALQRQLHRAGYLVHCVGDGPSALALARTGTVDLAILDLFMPGMNGIATCQALRQIPGWEDIPILFLTGTQDAEVRAQAIQSGADDFLTKPVQPEELLLRAKSLIRIRGLVAELRAGVATVQAQNDLILKTRQAQERLEAFLLHDLKNPITSILLQAELMIDKEPQPASPWARVYTAAEHLMTLVASWMDNLRAQEQGLQPALAEVPVRPFLEEILARHALWLKVRNIQGLVLLEDAQLSHPMDRVLMDRVVGNLLDNALRFSPDGGKLTLLAAKTPQGGLHLQVLDEGPGVPEEQRERLFDLYAQLESTTSRFRDRQNRGLGLAFCKTAVESHGGRIWVDNNPDGGSRFNIELP